MLISNTKSSFQENIQDEADDDDLNLNDVYRFNILLNIFKFQ